MKALVLLFGFYWAGTAFAQPKIYDPTQYKNVPDSQVIEQLIPSLKQPLKLNLDLLVWNTHKGSAKEAWRSDLVQLAVGKSLVLLQEGMQDSFMPGALAMVPAFGWTMAKTFYMNIDHNATGVITGSLQDPDQSYFIRSREFEPIINTPKITLLTTYVMEDGSQIIVGNIHAINFQSPEPFYHQVDDLMAFLANWKGKIILAGDFNTWIPVRTKYLVDKATTIGLNHVAFANDPRPLEKTLDHIFVRGCEVQDAKILSDIRSSDHPPLTADLSCAH
jgi:endonuclease/exonuclease/phosphatase (EEP) superfamily protein YafD